MKTIHELARTNIQTLTPYQSARKIGGQGTLWLNANEYALSPTSNDFGVNFDGLDFLSQANRYPEPQPANLIQNYATYANLARTQVLVTRGGDEGIELVMRAFCEPNEGILYCPPTYGMYKVSADTLGIRAHTVPLSDSFHLDLPAIKSTLDNNPDIKVVFVCNPNNPTGTLTAKDDIKHLLALTQGRSVVVVDEAYIEFSPTSSMANELDGFEHLIIIRTLSKAFGLAGLRTGFVLANPAVIDTLAKVIAPYPIPAPSAVIAAHALNATNIAIMKARAATLVQARDTLAKALSELPIIQTVYDSWANFVLVKFTDGQAVFDKLWQDGIILRNQHTALGLANCVRITIGSDDENSQVMSALANFNDQPKITDPKK